MAIRADSRLGRFIGALGYQPAPNFRQAAHGIQANSELSRYIGALASPQRGPAAPSRLFRRARLSRAADATANWTDPRFYWRASYRRAGGTVVRGHWARTQSPMSRRWARPAKPIPTPPPDPLLSSPSPPSPSPSLTAPRSPEPEELLTLAEVATMCRVDPKTVTRWMKAGKLTSIRTLGGHRRYREVEVRRLLEAIRQLPPN